MWLGYRLVNKQHWLTHSLTHSEEMQRLNVYSYVSVKLRVWVHIPQNNIIFVITTAMPFAFTEVVSSLLTRHFDLPLHIRVKKNERRGAIRTSYPS